MNDIKQFKSILKQGISRNTDVLLGCEFLEKLLNIINDYENTKNQLQQKENIIKEVREYIENNDLYEQDYDYDYEENLVVGPPSDETARKILLEILDKVEEK